MNDDDSDMTLLANDPGERAAFETAITRMNAGHSVEVDPATLEPIEFHRVTLLEASDGQPAGASGTVVDESECGRAWIIELDDPDAPVIYARKEICAITATGAQPPPQLSDHT